MKLSSHSPFLTVWLAKKGLEMTHKRAQWLKRCRGRICSVHRWMVLVPTYVTPRCTDHILTVRIVVQRPRPPGATMAEWIRSSSIFLSFLLSMFVVDCEIFNKLVLLRSVGDPFNFLALLIRN